MTEAEELAKAEQFAADLIERWKAGADVALKHLTGIQLQLL